MLNHSSWGTSTPINAPLSLRLWWGFWYVFTPLGSQRKYASIRRRNRNDLIPSKPYPWFRECLSSLALCVQSLHSGSELSEKIQDQKRWRQLDCCHLFEKDFSSSSEWKLWFSYMDGDVRVWNCRRVANLLLIPTFRTANSKQIKCLSTDRLQINKPFK